MAANSTSRISPGVGPDITGTKNTPPAKSRKSERPETVLQEEDTETGDNSTTAEQHVCKHTAPRLAGVKRGNQADAPRARRLTHTANDAKICNTKNETDGAEKKYEIDAFVGHQWVNAQYLVIEVRWVGWEGTTWEAERDMHEDAPETLFNYWRSVGGRPDNPQTPDLYNVLAIVQHNKSRTKFLVRWVGYEQESWEPRKTLEGTVKDMVDEYLQVLKAKERAEREERRPVRKKRNVTMSR